ncbi:hypothetical protein [Achromobacter sp.]|uniref:hypothetical protein n=1 Tax=Achromobacter sp. TaxID=134375 RepID=UPI0028AA5FA7|nr:hypothetical protein [Achromobacter sp.]
MADRRKIVTDRFKVQDESGNQHTVMRLSDQTDGGGLDGSNWIETMGRLVTSAGHAVKTVGPGAYYIVDLGLSAKRVG